MKQDDPDNLPAVQMLKGDEMTKAIKSVLPSLMTPNRYFAVALAAAKIVAQNPKVNQNSIVVSVFQSAKLGLDLTPMLGHAFLVPFKNICQLIPGYKGFIYLAGNTGRIINIKPGTIYKGEDYDYYTDNKGEHFYHKPPLENRNEDKVLAYYIQTTYNTGQIDTFLMTREQVLKHRNMSAQWQWNKKKGTENTTVWYKHEEPMGWKTCVRMKSKFWILSNEPRYLQENMRLQNAVFIDERAERGKIDMPEELKEIVPPINLNPEKEISEPQPRKRGRPKKESIKTENKQKTNGKPKAKQQELFDNDSGSYIEYKDLAACIKASPKDKKDKWKKTLEDYLSKNNKTFMELEEHDYKLLIVKLKQILK